MRVCSNLCADVVFIIIAISQRPDIQSKSFNACIKLIQGLSMMMVWALMGHIINIIFKMKYELHVYEIENVFKN